MRLDSEYIPASTGELGVGGGLSGRGMRDEREEEATSE